eukprot:g14766.t2
MAELVLVSIPVPMGIWLLGEIKALLGGRKKALPKMSWQLFVLELLAVLCPAVACMVGPQLTVTLVLSMAITSCCCRLQKRPYFKDSSGEPVHRGTGQEWMIDSVTNFRASVMLMTCITILAVDFQVFPRRFAKTEVFGTGLMDLGVGATIFASSLSDWCVSMVSWVLGLVGFVAIYYIAEELGSQIQAQRQKLDQEQSYPRFVSSSWAFAARTNGVLWALTLITKACVQETSRRMVNLTYVLWVCAHSMLMLGLLMVVDSLSLTRPISQILAAINSNMFPVFMVANLATGAINISMRTLDADTPTAIALLATYVTFVAGFAVTLANLAAAIVAGLLIVRRKPGAPSMKNSPPAKGKSTPKGKGTLFSFFSKAPSSSSKASETPTKPKTGQDTKTVTTPSTAGASPEQSSADSEDFVGKRIRVFWKDDGRWFVGKVVDYSLGKHTILYDDGDREKVVLKNEKFELVDEAKDEVIPHTKKRSKVIRDDDDDEEAEWDQDDVQDSGGDGGSAYESGDGASEDDDDDGSDDYAESDDTDEMLKTPQRKKPAPSKKKRAGQVSASNSARSGAKRLKKASDLASYAITETKTPGSSNRAVAGQTGQRLGSPIGTPSARSSTRSGERPMMGLSPPVASSPPKPPSSTPLPEGVLDTGRHKHHSFDWLYKNRVDANRRKPEDPLYNPRTLYVPPSFLKKETPAMVQWWKFKSENMDTVLFFKVGKFYELFHVDADIGMQELDLIYMKGEKAHSGFPEISYGKFADGLVSKGYRVARVEQVETPDMLKARNASTGRSGEKDKVVKRELCSILSRGTRTYCFLDDVSSTPDGSPRSVNMILSIKEVALDVSKDSGSPSEDDAGADGPPAAVCEYGVCMVDATTATFSVGQFADDPARSRLRTLLAQQLPVEIVMEKDNLSETTVHMIKCMAPLASHVILRNGDEFWDAPRTVRELKDRRYFHATGRDGHERTSADDSTSNNIADWPPILRAVVDGGKDGAMALSALGGATWHIRRALIDHDLLSMKRFVAYIPSDMKQSAASATSSGAGNDHQEAGELPNASSLPGSSTDISTQSHMILDGVSLSNLEVLRNSSDGGEKGSLWAFVNRCSTAFGRRLLKDWLLKPLLSPTHINARLDAVSELAGDLSPEADASRALMKKLPDVERLLSRVHSMASKHRSSEHPESRAIMYEDTKYSIRKVNDFLSVLDALERADRLPEIFSSASVESNLLQKCVIPRSNGGQFPDMSSAILYFRNAFDAGSSKKKGIIELKPGVDTAFDGMKSGIKEIKSELDGHLREQRKRLGCSDAEYWHSAKEKYQIQVPERYLSKNRQPSDYELKSKKKGALRFWTPFIKDQLERLAAAEQQLSDAQRDQMRTLFAKFDEHRELWAGAVRCLAHLDAVLSLAEVSAQPGFSRPQFYEGAATPSFIRLKNARHPCLAHTYQGGEYIPNDASLGNAPAGIANDAPSAPNMLLLTGPNMGGKSTLLRQTCLVAILAQVGCFVPADEAHLTPLDRIFTRVGASDRILAGQSTFFVELSETANILHHATSRSLVILDELGRGTSTFDGTAIAHAVAHYLVKSAKCLAMFATHYHSLVEDWGQHSEVALGHMSCLVEDSGAEQRVTFLYKLAPGPCPKSFGINVARLAQLPDAVISAAQLKSEEFERALSLQHTAIVGDEKGGVALRLLALLSSGEDDTEAVQAGKELQKMWTDAHVLASN